MSVERSQRHTRGHPCEVCGGCDQDPRGQGKRCNGYTSTDGEWCRCSRSEDAGALDPDEHGLYRHKMHGACRCGTTHAPEARTDARGDGGIEATYDYVDEAGDLLFQVVRKRDKKFLQRRPDGRGDWLWKLGANADLGLEECRRVLYRLPALLAADASAIVFVCEGEKDADTLTRRGMLATCNPHGAGKWKVVRELARDVLRGRRVIVWADNDPPDRKTGKQPGIDHARDIAASLVDVAADVRTILNPPERGKDAADFFALGGSEEELERLIAEAPRADAEPKKPKAKPVVERAPHVPLEPPPKPADDADGVTGELTDLRNSERLIEWYGDLLRYCASWGKWLVWDDKRWRLDEGARASRLAQFVARRLLRDAKYELGCAMAELDKGANEQREKAVEIAKARVKHALASQSGARLSSMLNVAKCHEAIVVHHRDLDADPWLLNVQNGTVDLRSGTLREHRREDMITKVAAVDFDADAKAPTWTTFLDRVMGGSEELIAFLQRAVGYSISGVIREHALFFCYGRGANGKSTFTGVVRKMLGDYGGQAAPSLLFRGGADRHPTERADLHGLRFVLCSEIEEGQSFNEALVKDITGGDAIKARRMNEDFWEFWPTHKPWINGNHKPIVRGDDDGIWRRMRLIPWTVTIPDEEKDPELPSKLERELAGIFQWALAGCLAWQRSGLGSATAVVDATSEYREESDRLGEFFTLHVAFEPTARVSRRDLRARYVSFCEENGDEPMGARRFAARLRERDVSAASVRTADGPRDGWCGLRILTDVERAQAMAWGKAPANGAPPEAASGVRPVPPDGTPEADPGLFTDWEPEARER